MSVAITQRPAAFCPVNNPVVYKFAVTGGPFTLYRAVIGVYKESDDTLIGEMSKSPDLSDNILADVSSILKTVLYRDWGIAVLNEDEIGSIAFYIKYQEFYTGSATSPIDDVANPSMAVIASRQIGSNAVLTEYIATGDTKKFLTLFDLPSLWRGYPFSISFLIAGQTFTFCWDEYDEGGIIKQNVTTPSSDDGLNRGFVGGVQDNTKTVKCYVVTGASFTPLSAGAWTNGFGVYAPFDLLGDVFYKLSFGAVSGYLAYTPVVLLSGETPRDFTLYISGTVGVSTGLNIGIAFIDGGDPSGIVRWVYDILIPAGTGAFADSFTTAFSNMSVGDADTLAVVVTGNVSDSFAISFNQQVYKQTAQVTEKQTIAVKDPCENPVYLFWKNTLGGDSFYLFDGSQDFGFAYNNEKAKRLTVFAEDISINEWEALNELNTIGSLFKTNIEELTTSVNKTKERSDQQIYVIDAEGNKIGVVNITNELTTATQQVKHMFMTTIEYPEIFLG